MMQTNFAFRYFCLILISSVSENTLAATDALFSNATNKLTIPYVSFLGHSYQAELWFEAPDTLKLQNVVANTGEPEAGKVVPVYDDLSFHLAQLRINDVYYQVDVRFIGDDRFKVTQIAPAQNTSPANSNFTTQHFSGSGNCKQCHDGIKDEQGKDVSIITAWESTMMANSLRDPFWKAQVRRELNQTPSQSALINDKCSRCHAPMANVEAKKQALPVNLFGDGLLNANHANFALAQDGVSCSLCHQIKNSSNFGTPAGFSGNYDIESFSNPVDRKLYGPFENVLTRPMQQDVNFTPTYSQHVKASEYCGTCHDLKTPFTDEAGAVLSSGSRDEFPEQMPYTEWKNSDYVNKSSCQQCHMKRSNGVIIAAKPQSLNTKRNDFAQHRFVGGNKLMLTMLQDYRDVLGVNAKDFTAVLTETDELMRNAASLNLSKPLITNDTLDFAVNITSKTGHKLPTSYPSRRMILHVVIKDQNQQVVFESGKVNADGSVVNLDADKISTSFEPHYDLITRADQVQVYEDVMTDAKGAVTYTLLRAKQYAKDNRLLPSGFDKTKVTTDIQVIGEALNDPDFVGGSDAVHFKIAGLKGNRYTLSAELIYQSLGYAFAQALFTDTAPEVQSFKQMFNASNLKSYPITQTTGVVTR